MFDSIMEHIKWIFSGVGVLACGSIITWFLTRKRKKRSEHEVAREFITYLEDKRVLYVPYSVEQERYVTLSIMDMRKQLTKELQKLRRSSQLREILREMRKSCREFLTRTNSLPPLHLYLYSKKPADPINYFYWSLGEFRKAVGILIGRISDMYKIHLEDELKSMVLDASDVRMADDNSEEALTWRPSFIHMIMYNKRLHLYIVAAIIVYTIVLLVLLKVGIVHFPF